MSEFSQIGGVEAAKRLIEFLSSPEPRVQAGALELIGVFIKGTSNTSMNGSTMGTNLNDDFRSSYGPSVATSRFVSSSFSGVQERASGQQIVRLRTVAVLGVS